MSKRKLTIVRTDAEIAARRCARIPNFRAVPPIASGGRPAERGKPISDETFRKVLAVAMLAAEPETAL